MPRKIKNSKLGNEKDDAAETQQGTAASEAMQPSSSLHINKRARALKFVDVTRQYSDGLYDAEEQKAIRAHVMQDFLRHKSGHDELSIPAAMKDTVQEHVIRFRYATRNTLRQNAAPATSYHRKIAMNHEEVHRTSANPPFRIESIQSDAEAIETWMPLPSDEYLADSTNVTVPPSPWIPSSLLGDRDPFAQLPIHASSEIHRMLHYYQTSYWTNSLANNPTGTFLSFAATDPALFHATLSIVCQHEGFVRRQPASRLFYSHRGEAIRILATRIGNEVKAISDATIAAVAVLSIADNEVSASSQVQWSHHNGLTSLISMRGGLDCIKPNDAVTRTVIWADLLHAGSHGTRPTTVNSKFSADSDGLAQILVDGDITTGPTGSQGYRSTVPSSLVPVFDMLRLLCVARSSPEIFDTKQVSKRKAFSNLLSRVEYILVDDYATASTRLPRCHDIEVNSEFSGRRDAVCEATVAGALIFSYWDLRELPISAQPFEYFARNLRASLDKLLQNRTFSACVSSALLLWLHFQGFKATSIDSRISDHRWFVDHACDICRALEVDTELRLEILIREVLVVRVHLKELSDLLIPTFWRAIRDHEYGKNGSELA